MTAKDLTAWQTGMWLGRETYDCGPHLPKKEINGLTSQVHRAAVSPSATGY